MVSSALVSRTLVVGLAAAFLSACGGPMPDEATSEDPLLIGGGGIFGCITYYGDDAGNTKGCAKNLPSSRTTSGTINWNGDEDWWKFYSYGAHYVATCSSRVSCEVHDSAGLETTLAEPFSISGWVYLRVVGSPGSYNLTVSTVTEVGNGTAINTGGANQRAD